MFGIRYIPLNFLLTRLSIPFGLLQFLDIVDENFPKPTWHHMPCCLRTTISDVWHQVHSLELPPDTVINTFWPSPVPLHLVISVRLVSGELLHPLFDNLGPFGWCESHGDYK